MSSIGPRGDDYKHTEFLTKADERGALGAKVTKIDSRSNQLRYKPLSAFESLSNFFNIQVIVSSIRALLASLFGPSNASKDIRNNFTVITNPTAVDQKIAQTAAYNLVSGLRSQPADVSLSEVQKLRADSALALFNMGFLETVVENYADWQTEGSEREGEVWKRAYDELRSQIKEEDFSPHIGQKLLSMVDVRYPAEARLKEKLALGKDLLENSHATALKTLDKAIAGAKEGAEKEGLRAAKKALEAAFTSYANDAPRFSKYDDIANAWFQLKLAVEDIPSVHDIMGQGYTEPSDKLMINTARLLHNYEKALKVLNDAISVISPEQPRTKERLEAARVTLQTAAAAAYKYSESAKTEGVSAYQYSDAKADELKNIGYRLLGAVSSTPAEEIMKKDFPFPINK